MKPRNLSITMLLTIAAGALTAQTAPPTASPGTINYIEGSVSVNGATITTDNGKTTLQPNQTLSTNHGKAEILLSPGAILRVGDNSEIRMVAPELVHPQIEVLRGSVLLELDHKSDATTITVLQRDARTSILKKGLYRFDSDTNRIAVLDGQLQVTENDHTKKIGKGQAVILNANGKLTATSFDRNARDDIYLWSQLRAESLANASATLPPSYAAYRGDGWYWNPYFSMYSWLPGSGYYYSPFGYPFYAFGYGGYYGFYGGPYHYYYPPRRVYHPPLGFRFHGAPPGGHRGR